VRYFYETESLALDVGVAPPSFTAFPQLNADGTQVVNESGQLLYTTAQRDASTGELLPIKVQAFNALGGKAYAIGSLELSFPLPYVPEELRA
jgi:hypothetical protein